MNRLIDQIQMEIQDKSNIYNITHVILSIDAFKELLADFSEEFEIEYKELGRIPSRIDVEEYLNLPIVVDKMSNGAKYNLLTKI